MGGHFHVTDKDVLQCELQNLTLTEGPQRSAVDLLSQCENLLAELELFQKYLVDRKQDTDVELRHFRSSVKAESKLIQKLSNADPLAERTAHTLRSSNFPFYAAVWDAAKLCSGIKALEKRFYWDPAQHVISNDTKQLAETYGSRHKRYSAIVDVVADDGLTWIKISTLTEKRILFDMAKAGWIEDSSSDENDDFGPDEDDDEPEGLMKQAQALLKASKATRVRYQHPTVYIMLPRIKCGDSKVVDELLNKIRALGIIVNTSESILAAPTVFQDVMRRLAVNHFAGFSQTVNVDCTVLLALVSDLSYSRVEKEDWHHRAVSRQIEMERDNQLLPHSLWPACGSRRLVCTREAAVRMQQIVDLIGTDSEKKRTACIMDNDLFPSTTARLDALTDLSEYNVPRCWQLPIIVVDVDIPAMKLHLPSVVHDIADSLSEINQSVFFYGWASGMTTISSNRTVAKGIEALVEANRTADSDRGPDIWISPASRSLVGKEKTRRNWGN